MFCAPPQWRRTLKRCAAKQGKGNVQKGGMIRNDSNDLIPGHPKTVRWKVLMYFWTSCKGIGSSSAVQTNLVWVSYNVSIKVMKRRTWSRSLSKSWRTTGHKDGGRLRKHVCCCVIAAFSDVEVHALFILDLFLILHSKYLISTFIITSVLGKWFFDGSFLGETLPPQQHPSMCFATAYTTPSCAPALSAEEYLPRRPWSAALGSQVTNSQDEVYFSLEYTSAAYESWESANFCLPNHPFSATEAQLSVCVERMANRQVICSPQWLVTKVREREECNITMPGQGQDTNVFDMHTQWKTEQQGGGIYKYIYICVLRVVCAYTLYSNTNTYVHYIHIYIYLSIYMHVYRYIYKMIYEYSSVYIYVPLNFYLHVPLQIHLHWHVYTYQYIFIYKTS